MLKNIDLKNLLIAIVISSGFMCDVISKTFNITSGANLIILILEIVVIILILLKKREFKIKINLLLIFLVGSVVSLFIISYFKYGFKYYSLAQFLFYCIIPIFCSCNDLDCKKVLTYIISFSLCTLPVLNSLFTYQYEMLSQIAMGSAYALAIPVIAAILHILFYYDKNDKVMKILYIYSLVLLIKLITVSNRGVILELCICLVFAFISKYNKSEKKKNNYLLYCLKVLLIGTGIFILYINLSYLLKYMYSFMDKNFNITISFLKKSSQLISQNNLDNGRDKIYNVAKYLISKKLLFGYGIRSFKLYTGEGWVHNLFYQFVFDGGLLFSIFPIAIILIDSIKVFASKFSNKNNYVLSLFLFVMVFPRHFVSNDIWLTPFVWLLLGYSIHNIKNVFRQRNNS